MRIIAGTAGGTPLAMPKGPVTRPTPDKVKQAIFSSLGERVVGARVLDLFCGTGALGLEALSRGASQALLVDESRFAVDSAMANATRARLEDRAEIRRDDVFRVIEGLAERGDRFDLVFADPPYEKTRGRESSLPKKLLNCSWLVSIVAPTGILVLEHFKGDVFEVPPRWVPGRQLRHGDTVVSLLGPRQDATE